MTVYFCCTSVYNLFMTCFLTRSVYDDPSIKKVLFLSEFNRSLIRLKSYAEKLGIWDEITVIPSRTKTTAELYNWAKAYHFDNTGYFHFFGFCTESFILFNLMPVKIKVIITDEGIATLNIEKYVKLYYNTQFGCPEFDYSKISEIWLVVPELSNNHLNVVEKRIPFMEWIESKDNKDLLLGDIKDLFQVEKFELPQTSLIFFDQYYSFNQTISMEVESHIIKEICEALNPYGLLIKRHPGEPGNQKYKGIKCNFLSHETVPWEALYLLSQENQTQTNFKRVFITYCSTSLLNQVALFNDKNCYVIFLNNILNRYTDENRDMSVIEMFMSLNNDLNFYFPDSFSVVQEIVAGIFQEEKKVDLQTNILNEMRREINFLRGYINNNWKRMPALQNTSTLFYDCGNGFEDSSPLEITNIDGLFDFSFFVPENCLGKVSRVKWYTVQGRNVQIKIQKIICYSSNNETICIDENELVYYDGEKREDGFFYFASLDPIFIFQIPNNISCVVIKGEWKFDNSYQGAVSVANEMASRLAVRLQNETNEKVLFSNLTQELNQKLDAKEENIEELAGALAEAEAEKQKYSEKLASALIKAEADRQKDRADFREREEISKAAYQKMAENYESVLVLKRTLEMKSSQAHALLEQCERKCKKFQTELLSKELSFHQMERQLMQVDYLPQKTEEKQTSERKNGKRIFGGKH